MSKPVASVIGWVGIVLCLIGAIQQLLIAPMVSAPIEQAVNERAAAITVEIDGLKEQNSSIAEQVAEMSEGLQIVSSTVSINAASSQARELRLRQLEEDTASIRESLRDTASLP